MVEVFVKAWDFTNLGLQKILVLSPWANNHSKLIETHELATVNATDAEKLIWTHITNVDCRVVKLLPVKHLSGVEGALLVEELKVGDGNIKVEGECLATTHGIHKVRTHILANSSIFLSTEGDLD